MPAALNVSHCRPELGGRRVRRCAAADKRGENILEASLCAPEPSGDADAVDEVPAFDRAIVPRGRRIAVDVALGNPSTLEVDAAGDVQLAGLFDVRVKPCRADLAVGLNGPKSGWRDR
jgi:hypothetical protein